MGSENENAANSPEVALESKEGKPRRELCSNSIVSTTNDCQQEGWRDGANCALTDGEIVRSVREGRPTDQDVELWRRQRNAPPDVKERARRERELWACGQYWMGARGIAS